MIDLKLIQTPTAGTHRIKLKGDTVTFTLDLSEDITGHAWLRTNLGHAHTLRQEIIQAVTHTEPLLGQAWYDIPMRRISQHRFKATLALCETGHFEAKCYFLPSRGNVPLWPAGENVSINVAPADTCCGNIIYNAFVRQFGPNKDGSFTAERENSNAIQKLDQTGYTVIPPSGTFRDLIAELDFIVGHLGCRILHLLPVNPTPTTYGRMGRFGSPYAALNFTAVNPALAVFDPKATPLEQFIELVDAVHARCAKIIIDIAPNHTGWAADLHGTHPEWLIRDKEGKIEAPGAWGVTWADLTRLNYHEKTLWQYMADVYVTWCRRGVDGFRCDAGYMIPIEAWTYIVAAVREEFPDTLFFLEGLGGKVSVTREILNTANFNWAYSELFQNYDRSQIEHYLPEAVRVSEQDGILVHFAETHDNNRLAATSTAYAAMRTALCALCSTHGAFGFANGVEWFAVEKIDVHNACSLNWNATVNQVSWIQRINHLLTSHPAFFDQVAVRLIQKGAGNCIAVFRHHLPTDKKLVVLVNLDAHQKARAEWDANDTGIFSTAYVDLLNEHPVTVNTAPGGYFRDLSPCQVCCLSPDAQDMETYRQSATTGPVLPERIYHQALRALALEVHRFYHGLIDLEGFDSKASAEELAADPVAFCRKVNPFSEESRVITWNWPQDTRRQTLLPPDHFLLIKAHAPFNARIIRKKTDREQTLSVAASLMRSDKTHFALLMPQPDCTHHVEAILKLTVYGKKEYRHVDAPLLYLTRPERISIKRIFYRKKLFRTPLLFLGTNGRGAMMRAHASWGRLESKYDALLAANLNPDFPVDRRMLLIRCRAWLVFQGYSQEISIDSLAEFRFDDASRCFWRFSIPCGQGQHVILSITAQMVPDRNRIHLIFKRKAKGGGRKNQLSDQKPVKLIIRPDIDDRNFHENTKAYRGPEHQWRSGCTPRSNGFIFRPYSDHLLDMGITAGEFVWEPEWQYMVYLPSEAQRGLDPHTDLFSPGYFAALLKGNETVELTATGMTPNAVEQTEKNKTAPDAPSPFTRSPSQQDPLEAMVSALKHYIVRRDHLKTIIAGYPWFLDWGRDTLIVVRGLIAAGFVSEAKTIIKCFAEFEKNGTLPNMIRGMDAENRDTSDAPLWFFVACKELIRLAGQKKCLDETCGKRTMRQVLISIGESYINGTKNGIHADPDTGLVFSPSHFTWMDTNHPAATPREGYPIEIQALWYYALKFLAEIDKFGKKTDWARRADQVQRAVRERFYMRPFGYLSDCLHAAAGTPAADAEIDDALRPNQLFAITLGAVTDPVIMRAVLESCESLVVPGAIRSLADQAVKRPLEITHHGVPCNDPYRPYYGVYAGDEDSRRKPAYHNGTAWTWIFPSFCEAWATVYGEPGKKTARAWLGSSDGDYPHAQRGCDAQAWGVSEWIRVWKYLTQ